MTPFAVFSPALAVGAAAAAVTLPLVIHLLFRKRYQVVPWAAIRFLLVAERRHRRRIDQWILLALRMLALLLPLFAMVATTRWAEALWQRIKPGATEVVSNLPRTHHVIVLDASLSMAARTDDGQTRFEKALAAAEAMIRNGNAGDGYTVLTVPGPANVPEKVVPGPANDPEKVVAELRKVKGTHGAADIGPVLAAVDEVLGHSPRAYPRRQVTFFTDLQRATWANALPKPDGTAPDVWPRITGKADVAVVDFARTDLDNLAVADLVLADPLPLVDTPVVVTATVQNYGQIERRLVRVELLLGRPTSSGVETLVPVEQKVIDAVPAGGRAAATFTLEGPGRFQTRGLHVIQVRLVEGDDVPADDTRSVVADVRAGLNVVLVDGKPDPEPLRRGAEYLFRALYPPGAKPSETPARPRVITPAELADPAVGDLSAVDCVFLCDVPSLTPATVAKLEAHLKRGGGLVIGLGPNAVANRDLYNRLLYADGGGMLPGPILGATIVGPDDPGFRLAADEETYRRPPLVAFRDDNSRAGLVTVPFRGYARLDAPPDGRGRRILSFVPAGAPAVAPGSAAKPDAAVVELPRHRGRVVVFTGTFNTDWTDWPVLPSFLPFAHELLRFAAGNPDRHTLRVGDALEEFFPPATIGLTADLTGPDGVTATLPIVSQDETGVARFADTGVSGLYRLGVGGGRDRVFAVNVPESTPTGGAESDLRRIDPSDLKSLGPIQVVPDVSEVKPTAESGGGAIVTKPKDRGPSVARVAVLVALVVLALETFLAWRTGPARAPGAGTAGGSAKVVERRWYFRLLGNVAVLAVLAAVGFALFAVVHAERTGNLLGFLPDDTRARLEAAAGVPAAAPGEGTRWRLEGFTVFVRNGLTDRRLVLGLAALAVVFTIALYRMERRAVGAYRRLVLPGLLRVATFLVALFVLLPQLTLAFDREGWPDIAILIDTSASMGTIDNLKDPAVRAKAAELLKAANLPEAHRLKLAQLLLTRKDADWLDRLLTEKQVKVHIYTVDSQTRLLTELDEASDLESARETLLKLPPDGETSRLGDGVQAVLKAFRGGSLSAIIMFTDGVTTAGDDLPKAARETGGVPLYLVGVGDAHETPDLGISDLKVDDVVTRGDELAFLARLTARGAVPPAPVPVVLYEKVGEKLVERARTMVAPNPTTGWTEFKVTHTPAEAGEKVFVLDVPVTAGETDTANNRVERTILVTEARRVRVLFVEGYPRYDFRFVKVLLERESERVAGNKTVEFKTVLLDASRGWAETDKSALVDFPTRDQLFEYDVVILGDFDPKQLPRASRTLHDLAEFVRIRGGGLMVMAGEHFSPGAFAESPLADVLPVLPSDGAAPKRTSEEQPLTEGYRPKLTPTGQMHPLFRFSPDDVESARIWARLQPMLWAAKGYRRKPAAEVLAVHPERPAEGGATGEFHPLVLQQFAGAGRVIFLGFDETWRWRWRNDEDQFNRFWLQAVRVLSRSRLGRVELKLDKQTSYRKDERIVVTVRFPDDAPAPPADTPVRVTVQRGPLTLPDGSRGEGEAETQVLALTKVEGTRATFQGALTRTPVGDYVFSLTEPEVPGTRPRAEAKVLPPPNERDRVEMNRGDLSAAAELSRGKVYTLATADAVFDELTALARVPLDKPCPPLPLWNQPAVFLMVLALLAAEWLLRKRERLV